MGDLIQAPPWKKWVIIGFREDQMHLSKVGFLDWYAAPTSMLLDPKNSDGSTPLYVAAIVGNEADVSKNKGIHKMIKDSYGNNLLHLVGRLIPTNKLNLISGAALQIQRELQWFKEVEGFVCPLNVIHGRTLEETLLYHSNFIRCPNLDI
ncbi:ankyrin repeat-containing domain, PGG domain protein [Artemisia annua]|uniref:Ankyrin repeat-containing domain, PGG domain protein n=1 Tax=Artemisia annua TaxID=35608 RepID=A0A2U1NVK3_ARTAN|nr:ankyrin repeat-containing domain, PGG domain protein [Artemisia annua]